MEATSYEHVVTDEDGVPHIKGTRTKIVELAAEHRAYGYSPAEVCRQHPHLSMGQVHSAMAYYFDHEEAISHDLERRRERTEALREELPESSQELMRHLRAMKERGEVPAGKR